MNAGELHLVEFAETLNNIGLLLRHDKQRGQEQERDDKCNDKERNKERQTLLPSLVFSRKPVD